MHLPHQAISTWLEVCLLHFLLSSELSWPDFLYLQLSFQCTVLTCCRLAEDRNSSSKDSEASHTSGLPKANSFKSEADQDQLLVPSFTFCADNPDADMAGARNAGENGPLLNLGTRLVLVSVDVRYSHSLTPH